MRYGKYTFTCRFKSNAMLPAYKGSTLRGAFGRALKQVICALKRQDCPGCLLKSECLYPKIFEPGILAGAATGRNMPLHPFILEPPLDSQSFYPEGAVFSFDLILLGFADERLPYFVYAVSEMGNIGVGKKGPGQSGCFVIEAVWNRGRSLYSLETETLSPVEFPETLSPMDTSESMIATQVSVNLETPLRIKHNNRFASELPFHLLVRAVLRRVSSLLTFFDGREPDLDYAGLVVRAEAVRTSDDTLVWEDWRRYSFRREEAMLLGGLKGIVVYSGDLSEFIPLLRFCEKVHVGKETTFGLGRFTLGVSS